MTGDRLLVGLVPVDGAVEQSTAPSTPGIWSTSSLACADLCTDVMNARAPRSSRM